MQPAAVHDRHATIATTMLLDEGAHLAERHLAGQPVQVEVTGRHVLAAAELPQRAPIDAGRHIGGIGVGVLRFVVARALGRRPIRLARRRWQRQKGPQADPVVLRQRRDVGHRRVQLPLFLLGVVFELPPCHT